MEASFFSTAEPGFSASGVNTMRTSVAVSGTENFTD